MEIVDRISLNYGYTHVMVYRVLHSLCAHTQKIHYKLDEQFKLTLFRNTGITEKQMGQILKELSLIGVIHRSCYLEGFVLLPDYVKEVFGKETLHKTVNELAPVKVTQEDEIEKRFEKFMLFYNKKTNKRYKTSTWKDKAYAKFKKLINDGYTAAEFEIVINNMLDDENVNDTYITPEYICRADKFEKYLNVKPKRDESVYPSKIVK